MRKRKGNRLRKQWKYTLPWDDFLFHFRTLFRVIETFLIFHFRYLSIFVTNNLVSSIFCIKIKHYAYLVLTNCVSCCCIDSLRNFWRRFINSKTYKYGIVTTIVKWNSALILFDNRWNVLDPYESLYIYFFRN